MASTVTQKHKKLKLALQVSTYMLPYNHVYMPKIIQTQNPSVGNGSCISIIHSFTNNGPSSQIQQHNLSTINSFSIECVESSIQNLSRNWYRRQKWKDLFSSAPVTPPQEHDRAPRRTHLASFLESTPVHAVSLTLLIIDLIFTILELSSSLLATSCSPKENHKATEEIWYHWVGIAILTLLSAKNIALAVALGTTFFRRPVYVIYRIVLIGALMLEVLLQKVGGLLLVVSLWRAVRVVESAFEPSDEAIEAQIEVVCQFEMLKEENRRLLETIAEKDQIIQELQEDLDQRTCYYSRSALPYK